MQNLFKPNCAVASWSNLTVVCGGLNRNNTASNEFFQVRDGIWEKMSPMKESRVGAAAIFAKGNLNSYESIHCADSVLLATTGDTYFVL